MEEIKKLVLEICGRRGNGYYYIFCCALQVAINHQPQEIAMKSICLEVQTITGKNKIQSISKALSRATNDIWEHGNIKRLEQILGRPIIEKPMPKDLIIILAQYIWQNQKH